MNNEYTTTKQTVYDNFSHLSEKEFDDQMSEFEVLES